MAQLGADCLLVTESANIFYLSGIAMASPYVPQALLVLADEVDPVLFLRKLDLPIGLAMAYMADEKIIAYPESLIGNSGKSGYDFMFDWIATRAAIRSVGLEFDALSGATLDSIRAGGRREQDLSGVIMAERLVKSAAECALLREAAILTDNAMRVAHRELTPGAAEPAVAAAVVGALIAGPDGL